MYVVAGPAGSGKSNLVPLASFGVDHFNVDDAAAALHGSFVGIPAALRAQAGRACETFVGEHIALRRSFAVETTLRTTISIEQARAARGAGFVTTLVYVGTSDASINVERVRIRGLMGGHSAPPSQIREIYAASLANLRLAVEVFDDVHVYDNSAFGVVPAAASARVVGGVARIATDAPAWVAQAVAGRSGG
jgi:predicted ABC-type ATPase